MKLLIIGSTGLVGTNIAGQCRRSDVSVVGTSRRPAADAKERKLNKNYGDEVNAVVTDVNPDVVVDTAAFHDVDACDTERDRTWSVNAQGTRNVAAAADDVGAHMIYLSTDYVFPGLRREAPYSEEDAVAPVNYYAQTKYAGEQAAKVADDWTVLRTSVVYGLASPNFVTWALSELRAGNELDIVDDQISTPTYAPDLARACVDVAERGLVGLYHAAGPTSLSRYEFTRHLADVYGYDKSLVNPISTEEFGQEAPRPADGSLDSTTLYDAIDHEFRAPREGFENMNRES
ncbi:dTDP-4-dehydrorhamnose reductase [Halobacterium hubeiense]|uniref:dTDP-4-dehydrorhamnose reductase n=1 Tax=Halobacterium hubeiense TaxID=1407499 RepID=UPI003C782005